MKNGIWSFGSPRIFCWFINVRLGKTDLHLPHVRSPLVLTHLFFFSIDVNLGRGKKLLPLNWTAAEGRFYLGWLCQLGGGVGWLAVIKRGVISEFHTKQTLRHQNLAVSIIAFCLFGHNLYLWMCTCYFLQIQKINLIIAAIVTWCVFSSVFDDQDCNATWKRRRTRGKARGKIWIFLSL